jgi:hypothetical protein
LQKLLAVVGILAVAPLATGGPPKPETHAVVAPDAGSAAQPNPRMVAVVEFNGTGAEDSDTLACQRDGEHHMTCMDLRGFIQFYDAQRARSQASIGEQLKNAPAEDL